MTLHLHNIKLMTSYFQTKP